MCSAKEEDKAKRCVATDVETGDLSDITAQGGVKSWVGRHCATGVLAS